MHLTFLAESSKVLVAVSNFSFKSWQNFSKLILVGTRVHRFQIWFYLHLSSICHNISGDLVEKPAKEEIWFPLKLTTWMTEHPDLKICESQASSGPVFTICGNPRNFSLTDASIKLFFPSRLPTIVLWFLKEKQVILESSRLYTSVGQPHKRKFWLE